MKNIQLDTEKSYFRLPGNYKVALFITILLLSSSFNSCKKFLEIPAPKTELVSSSVFTDDNTATSAVVGIYSDIMQTFKFLSQKVSFYPGFEADELSFPRGSNATDEEFLTNSLVSSNTDINYGWATAYQSIYDANACIAGLNNSTGVTPAVKSQLLGEAQVIRALNYFYLVNLFGDVPLILTTDYSVNATIARTPAATVNKQIIQDLVSAQSLLPESYVTDSRVRPNKWTATALLARAYLYNKDWSDAEIQASAVINSGVYSLSSLSQTFIYTSNETIWQLMPVSPTYNTLIGFYLIASNTTSAPIYPLSDDLINSFEPGDLRLSAWTRTSVVSGVTYHSFYKYKIKYGSNPLNEYFIVTRLAELYLIRAEARLNQQKNTAAINDINVIRSRAGLSPLSSTLSAGQIATALEHERRIELFCEWGHRWLDLKRNNRLDAAMGAYKPTTWKSTDALWPIPLPQIDANPKLVQNPGY